MSTLPLANEQPSWKKLHQIYESRGKQFNLRQAFSSDSERFSKYSRHFTAPNVDVDLLFDFSKNLIDDEILSELLSLAKQANVEGQRDAMYAGEHINTSEDRAVLHVALRDLRQEFGSKAEGVEDVLPELKHMREFSDAVRGGQWTGYTGKRIASIVNIGIGGSDLGPVMVTEALKPYEKRDLKAHFVSNVDGTHVSEILRECDPETTLFIVASKTFTTQETMTNATTARDWFLKTAGDKSHVAKHFVALSTNEKAAGEFGIAKENLFKFRDWVGGRYSLWSAIGLSICLTIGYENFEQLLEGAHAMDKHFKTAPLDQNIPVLLAVIGLYYIDFYGAQTKAILPYDQYLHRFTAYLQQANMESNGKGVAKDGRPLPTSGPIVWGEPGTNGQHSFHQLIHQGTKLIPCDFLAPIQSQNPIGEHHAILLSNFLAQTEALAFGKTADEVKKELGAKDAGNDVLVKSKVFGGSRPSNSFLFKKLTPATLGALIAMYEMEIFVQGAIWQLNSFDQMGVELGKQLAKSILPILQGQQNIDQAGRDSSTTGLVKHILANRQ